MNKKNRTLTDRQFITFVVVCFIGLTEGEKMAVTIYKLNTAISEAVRRASMDLSQTLVEIRK